MTAICPSLIHLCYMRFTRLDETGDPTPGPNNVYVIDTPIMLTITPDVLAGEVKDQKGGCDQLITTYRGQDIVKRYNLELDYGTEQPGLDEMLTGGDAIVDTSGDPIGIQNVAPCGTQTPLVVVEAWQDLWDCDHQPSTPYQFLRRVWPGSRWTPGAITAQNDITNPKYTAFTLGNAEWGTGIFNDVPEAIGAYGAKFFDNHLPTTACGWQTQAIT